MEGESLRLFQAWLKPKQKEEAKQIASKMLSVMEEMRMSNYSLPKQTLLIEVEEVVYNCFGDIDFVERTKESTKIAVKHFDIF